MKLCDSLFNTLLVVFIVFHGSQLLSTEEEPKQEQFSQQQNVKRESRQIKWIDVSWSNPTVEFLAEHIQQIEVNCPMNGVTVRINGNDSGNFIPGEKVMSRQPWKYEWFRDSIERYKKIPFHTLTDNFFYTVASPGDADWTNDQDWSAVCNNYAIAARIAKETGMRGLFFDIEEYDRKFWNYSTVSAHLSYEQAYEIAKQRGREWGKAVFAAYPNVVLLAPFTSTYGENHFSLTIPFFNGLLSVMPPQATLYDGHEEQSYRAKNEADYDSMIRLHYRESLDRILPDNRMKYQTQVKLSPGIYMDAIFTDDKNSIWYTKLQPEIGNDAKSFFLRNLIRASRVADDFVWIYSEHGAWWNNAPHHYWEKRFPGVTEIVRAVKNPDLVEVSSWVNLLKNPDFKEKQKYWFLWQFEQDHHLSPVGRGFDEAGLLKIEGVNSASFVQTIAVKPGQTFLARCTACYDTETSGFCSFGVAFKAQNEKWMPFDKNPSIIFPKEQAGKWFTRSILFTVPEDVYFVAFLMNGMSLRPNGRVAFKNAGLFQYSPEYGQAGLQQENHVRK